MMGRKLCKVHELAVNQLGEASPVGSIPTLPTVVKWRQP